MLSSKKFFTGIILLWLFSIPDFAQNLELIGSKNPFKINGGISASQVIYVTTDSVSGRDPYSFYVTGNLNASIYDWNIPLSFTWSNQNHAFQQPFNQYSLHPKYKWITAHIGSTSMSFSPYTLSGHLFTGAGIDLTPPGKFKFSAMLGRLNKAVPFDSSKAETSIPVFERWGYGIKSSINLIAAENYSTNIDLILFHAKDKVNSLFQLPDTLVQPQENLVLGASGNIMLFKKFQFNGEFARSALTRNIRSVTRPEDAKKMMTKLGGIFNSNTSTGFFNGFKMNGVYNGKFYSVGIGYERIDPDYQTLGGYYFNNDLENVTLNGSIKLAEGKVSMSGNVGKQKDNLNKQKVSEFKRWVTSINLSYSPGQKVNVSLVYSNFQSFTNIRSKFTDINQLTPYDNLDTLNFTQLSENAACNVNYTLSSNEKQRQNINFNINLQQAAERQSNQKQIPGSLFFNINSTYSYTCIPLNFTLMTAVNANINKAESFNTTTLGPTISANKMFFNKKLRSSMSCSFNKSYAKGDPVNRTWSVRNMNSWKVKKKHSFTMSLVMMNRKLNIQKDPRKLTEFSGTLGYSFNF